MTRTHRHPLQHFFTTLAALPLLAALAFAPEGARAQWATSGDNINNTNTGNVGVGTADPEQKLGVEGMFGIYPTTWAQPSRRGLFIFHGGTDGGSIYAYNYPAGTGDPIGLSASSFGFSTFVGGNPLHRLTLTNGGNLGIGTTAPDTDLVGTFEYGPTVKVLQLDSTRPRTIIRGSLDAGLDLIDADAGANAKWMQLHNNDGVTKFRSITDAGTIQGDNILVLDNSTGNVGIGTATPNTTLHVKDTTHSTITLDAGSGTHDGALLFQRGGVNQWFLQARNSGAPLDSFALYDAINGAFRLTVNRNGNVGVGTTTPGFRLDVQGGQLNASGGLCIAGSCKASWSEVGASQWASGGSGISYSAGNVGVGTANPSTAKLVVSGTAGAEGLDLASTDQYANLRVIRNSLSTFDKDLYLQFGAGAGSRLRLYSNNAESMTIVSGNVGIGTTTPATKLHVAGTIKAGGDIEADGIIRAKYQDVAEWVPSSQQLAAGTVVVLDEARSNHVLASMTAYDTRVAGVVSAQPGLILGEAGEGRLMVATTGRVKVRVDATRAPVRIGDLLVTSDAPGLAMKSEPMMLGGRRMHAPGTIIGKALEPLAQGTGEILVLLSLQ